MSERREQFEAGLQAIERRRAVDEVEHAKLERFLAVELGITVSELRKRRKADAPTEAQRVADAAFDGMVAGAVKRIEECATAAQVEATAGALMQAVREHPDVVAAAGARAVTLTTLDTPAVVQVRLIRDLKTRPELDALVNDMLPAVRKDPAVQAALTERTNHFRMAEKGDA